MIGASGYALTVQPATDGQVVADQSPNGTGPWRPVNTGLDWFDGIANAYFQIEIIKQARDWAQAPNVQWWERQIPYAMQNPGAQPGNVYQPGVPDPSGYLTQPPQAPPGIPVWVLLGGFGLAAAAIVVLGSR